MDKGISPELRTRLEKIARQRKITLETLLIDYATQLEQAISSTADDGKPFLASGLVESPLDFVCRYTPDTKLTYVNPAYCAYFERSENDLLGSSFLSLSLSMDKEAILSRIQEVLQNPAPDVHVIHHFDSTGRKRWVQWIDWGIRNESGVVTEIEAIGRDISSVLETQERLNHQEELLSTLFKTIPALLGQLDEHGQWQQVNDYWFKTLGWTIGQIQGHPDFWAALYPDPLYRQEVFHFLQSATTEWQDFQTLSRDGEMRAISWSSVRLSHGRQLLIGLDISARKETERILKRSEKKYRNLVETSHDLIWAVDMEGRITFINQAAERIYGLAPEALIGRLYTDFVPETQREANFASWATAVANNDRLYNFENWVQDKNGNKTLLNTNAVLVRDEQGQLIGSMGIAQDITHRVELENQRFYASILETELAKEHELIQMKDHFLSLISHEFRTPLTVMNTSIELITRYFKHLSSEQLLKRLATVQGQIQRMVTLMEDALRFSKSRAGKIEPVLEDLAIFAFCQPLIETVQVLDESREIVLSGDDSIVRADPKLLEHILFNLLSNALKYSPSDTSILLNIQRQEEAWQFTVQDQGLGIPQEDLAMLFEPFYRASNARNLQGTGLGLAIVKDYVTAHGGDIQVKTELGVGTSFTFTLPL